jgi:glycopeptide antibiotics resistance protein
MPIDLSMQIELADGAYSIAPFAIIILLVLWLIGWWRSRNLAYLACFAIFSVYMLFVINIVIFPLYIDGIFAEQIRRVSLRQSVNLIPFNFNTFDGSFVGLSEDSLVTTLQNILFTLPFGFGLSFVAPVKGKHFLWLALGFGLVAEGLQLFILLLGYSNRIIDINDVIMNALGVLLGYAAFRLFAWLYLWLIQAFKLQDAAPLAFMNEVAQRN